MAKKIILIAGPSGAGKTTISEYLTDRYQIPRVITHTTRPKRPGESRTAYYFEDDDSFAQLHFFEHVKYGDYQYGSSKEGLERAWAKNDLVSLIVDIKGARSYLEALGDQVYFLYVTCSLDTLAQRMADRGDASDQIKKRLAAEGDLCVGDNQPYAVSDATDYAVPVHGERRGLPHVAIEIRQDLIADAAGQTLWADRLAGVLAGFLDRQGV